MSATQNTTCSSCLHLSLDGRFCHLWHRPMQLDATCPQHAHMNNLHLDIATEVRHETSPRKHKPTNK